MTHARRRTLAAVAFAATLAIAPAVQALPGGFDRSESGAGQIGARETLAGNWLDQAWALLMTLIGQDNGGITPKG